MAYEWEAEEARDAQRYARTGPGDCHCCDYRANGRGGGTCAGCGDSITREEM